MGFFSSLFKTKLLAPKMLNSTDRDHVKSKWREIEELVKLGKPSQLKQAVIEADKLLELVLRRLINESQSLGANLKEAKDLFPSWEEYQKAWEAHKVRNALLHESNFEPTSSLVKDVVDKYRNVLVSLRAM